MNHCPYYPPRTSQQKNNDRLGQDLYTAAEILIIFIAIAGIWKYIVVPVWEDVIIPLWKWWNRSFNTKEKLIILALLALTGYLSWQVFQR